MVEKRAGKHAVIAAQTEPVPGELRKAVDAVYVYPHQGKLTLVARKAFNLLLANAMEEGVDQEWYEIQVGDLARNMRFESNDMRYLEETLNAMQVTLLKWDVLETIGGESMHVRDYVQLLGAVRLVGGVDSTGRRTGLARTVRYQFDKRVKQRLLVPEVYARINLQLQTQFSSSYTLALYEQVIRFKSNLGTDGWAYTVKLPWRDWRNLILGGDHASSYDQYKYFSRDVLNKALKELNEVVEDFEFEVVIFRDGRSIDKLQFRIRTKAQRSLGLPMRRPLIDTDQISGKLQRFGLRGEEIAKVLKDNDLVAVEEAASVTELRLRRNDLNPLASPAAYFHDALKRARDQMRSGAVSASGGGEPAKKIVADGTAPSREVRDVELLDSDKRRRAGKRVNEKQVVLDEWEAVEAQFRSLGAERREELIDDFVATLNNPMVVRELSKRGFEAPLVRAAFVPWLKRTLDI